MIANDNRLPAPQSYEVVFADPDLGLTTLRLTEKNLIPALEIRGHAFTEISRNPRHRADLQGQPKFAGLCGPMYGAPGLIRYEDTKAYAHFSA